MTAIEDIAAERRRQIEKEGWTPEHDDTHRAGEMAMAAVCYAAPQLIFTRHVRANATIFCDPWPWDEGFDKRPYVGGLILPNQDATDEERRRMLVKAGALIAAEIERLDRKAEEQADG